MSDKCLFWSCVVVVFFKKKTESKLESSHRTRFKASSISSGNPAKVAETCDTEGASPSAPKLPCRPSNEHAKSRAAAQDRMEPHRCNQDWRCPEESRHIGLRVVIRALRNRTSTESIAGSDIHSQAFDSPVFS